LKPWRKFSALQTVFMRSIEKHKKHLRKRLLFFGSFFWRSKKNEQKESYGGVKIIREMHRKIKSALKSKIHESFEKEIKKHE